MFFYIYFEIVRMLFDIYFSVMESALKRVRGNKNPSAIASSGREKEKARQ
jgi:hypothetical protein